VAVGSKLNVPVSTGDNIKISNPMIKNYLIIALRNLLKHKTFSAINIFGLAVGIACCVLLSLFIKDEFSYEKHFNGHESIFRLYTVFVKDGKEDRFPFTSPPVALGLADEFPEVETATRVLSPPEVEQHLVRYKDKSFYEKQGYLVDSTFFDVFSYQFQEGNGATALDGPSSVVLSAEMAGKLFGSESPLDELVIINSGWSTDTVRVTGVLKPFDNPSHINANFYMCMNSKGWGAYVNSVTTWAWQNFVAGYIRLKPNSTPNGIEDKMPSLIERHSGKDLKEAGMNKEIHLQPLDDVRLYSDFKSGFFAEASNGILYVYILASIGIFILLLACINFMNLTTAKASQRAGEVGVRKTLGASRQNLVRQFLGESFTIVLIAMLLSAIIVQLVLPSFNNLVQKNLELDFENTSYLLVALAVIGGITALVAGSYPPFFLSSFQPSVVLKDKRLAGGGNFVRKGLVVLQFVISITLISSIVIIQRQLSYMQSKPLGFEPQQKILVPLRSDEAKRNYISLRNSFQQTAGVEKISGTSSLPGTALLRDFPVYAEGSTMEKAVNHRNIFVDGNYFEVLNIPIVAGRDFVWATDSMRWRGGGYARKIIVNRESLKSLGIEFEKAVGAKIYTDWEGKKIVHEVIGVIEDYHQMSLRQKIVPMLFFIHAEPTEFGFVTLAINGDYQNIREQLATQWKTIVPTTPFEMELLTDVMGRLYEPDRRMSSIITIFTVLAIIISCLGLYGLSVFVTERKVKEIGIRKVMGASVSGIVAMLSKEFIILVLIAFVIAIPIGFYAMNTWLQNFEYRMELNVFVFIISGAVAMVIAWLTVGFESLKAARGNPVDSLRSE
jgi:putative ABC transport system permease protein